MFGVVTVPILVVELVPPLSSVGLVGRDGPGVGLSESLSVGSGLSGRSSWFVSFSSDIFLWEEEVLGLVGEDIGRLCHHRVFLIVVS